MIALAMGLALAACGGQSDRSNAPVRHDEVDRRAPEVQTQAARLRFERPGQWFPIVSQVGPLLFARDAGGARILAVRPGDGYDVHLVDLRCDRGAAWMVTASKGSEHDAAPVRGPGLRLASVDLSSEMRRMCALKAGDAAAKDAMAAAAMLRGGLERLRPEAQSGEAARFRGESAPETKVIDLRNGPPRR